jgi:hypothetical protein
VLDFSLMSVLAVARVSACSALPAVVLQTAGTKGYHLVLAGGSRPEVSIARLLPQKPRHAAAHYQATVISKLHVTWQCASAIV